MKGEKAKESSVGATVLLTMEHMPKMPPRMPPARGPKRIAPRITGIWVVVAPSEKNRLHFEEIFGIIHR